jgi:hypothetical protein
MLYGFGGYAQYPLASLIPGNANAFAIAALAGSVVAMGKAAALNVAEATAPASYSLAGATATFSASLRVAGSGAVVTGVAAPLGLGESAAAGNYLLASSAASFKADFRALAAGAYLSSSSPAPLVVSLSGLVRSYSMAGYPSVYSRGFEDWFPRPFDTDRWIGRGGSEGAWIMKTRQSDNWNERSRSAGTWTLSTSQPETWTDE